MSNEISEINGMYSVRYNGINLLIRKGTYEIIDTEQLNRMFGVRITSGARLDELKNSNYYAIPAFKSFVDKVSSIVHRFEVEQNELERQNNTRPIIINHPTKEIVKYVDNPVDTETIRKICVTVRQMSTLFTILIIVVIIMVIISARPLNFANIKFNESKFH